VRLSRRQFVAWGLGAGAALSVQTAAGGYLRHVWRTAARADTPVASICRACPAGCGIVGYLRDGKRLTAIMGNPEHPVSRGKICAQALQAINLHHHPERLRQGFRRDGQPQTTEALIEQAAREIAERTAAGARLVVDTWDEMPGQAMLLSAIEGDAHLIGRETLGAANRMLAQEEVWGRSCRPDLRGADLLLVFGADPYAGGPRFIREAREIAEERAEHGMRMIVFDPRLSNTGGRADLWAPIRPGTDHVAAMAIARYALEQSLLTETMTLRNGTITYLSLTKAVDAFDLDSAARVCGVEPELLRQAGELYVASHHPAVLAGEGVFQQRDPLGAYRAIALLEAMREVRRIPLQPSPGPVPTKLCWSAMEAESFYQNLFADDAPTVLITHRANPVYERGPAFARGLREAKNLLHISLSPLPNETTQMADLVIPEALPLESYGRQWLSAYVETPTYVEQQPVAQPPEGVWTGEDIFRALAEALGVQENVYENHDFDLVRQLTGARNFTPIGRGIYAGDEAARATISYRASLGELEALQLPAGAAPDKHKLTVILHDTAVANRDSAPAKWSQEIQHAPSLLVHPDDARRLRVRDGALLLLAGRRGDEDESLYEVMVRVFVSHGVRPGCAAIAREQGHDASGRVAAAQPFKSPDDTDMRLLWWREEGNGENLMPLLQAADDVTGALIVWPPLEVEAKP